jgi:hypothetical protein
MAFLRRIALVLAASALGCVINVGEDDCSECDNAPRCHSHLDEATQQCFCDPGHTWTNPGNDHDFECQKIPPKPGTSQCVEENSYVLEDSCFCEPGFKWCSGDLQDLTCCVDEEQAPVASESGGGTDTDATAGETGDREVPLPACDVEGKLGCTNPSFDSPGPAYQCIGGAWVDYDEDAHCQSDPANPMDFGYGCYLDAGVTTIKCANGPGSACTETDRICIDGTTLHFCQHARLTARDCNVYCTMESMPVFEQGRCENTDCVCCSGADCPM